jgi:radical SAM/Cys-rich protein
VLEPSDLGVSLASIESGPKPVRSMLSRRVALAPPAAERSLLEGLSLRNPDGTHAQFDDTLARGGVGGLSAGSVDVLQLNLGKLCNMTCRHCHVDAGPDRTDAMMTRETIEACFRALDQVPAHTVDITGGAPELHPDFRYVVDEAVRRGKHVIDRCNLTILLVPKFRDLPAWLAERGVEIVASLPHHRKLNTDKQRGDGTFEKSIDALRRLNAAGYGSGDPRRRLTLMSNPAGAYLGGSQAAMEREWKRDLARAWGVTFDRLFVLNNMPISRFLEWLVETGNLDAYMELLLRAYNPAAVDGLMCRNTLSVGWDGRLFDCDFNQMLDIECRMGDRLAHVSALDPAALRGRRIQTARHCYGCTAGSGSSCGGATT